MDAVRKQLQKYLGTTYKSRASGGCRYRTWNTIGSEMADLEGAIEKYLAFSKA
jgi:hypothetical protein